MVTQQKSNGDLTPSQHQENIMISRASGIHDNHKRGPVGDFVREKPEKELRWPLSPPCSGGVDKRQKGFCELGGTM